MMRITNLLLVFFIFISALVRAQGFYDINSVNTIEITFAESNWDAIMDQMVADGNEERLMGSVSINGVVFDSVGVRYKGNSTYQANRVKNPLNIKLDYIINDQTMEGYGTIKLANGFKDPTFIREVLGYEIARKYFPAGLANYSDVYINGTHLGLYTNDQSVDKLFAQTHYGSDENAFFKGELNEGKVPTGSVWEYFGTDSTDYFDYYTQESDQGWDRLIHFLDTLNNHNAYTPEVLNIDRHLWFLAFSNLTVNLDGPINNPQNYYVYQDNNGRFNPSPWDLNECFGVFTMHQTLGPLGTVQLQQMSPFANQNEADFPVVSKILSNATYKKMYVAHMKTMIEENFADGQYESRALEIQDMIDAYVQGDPNKFFTYNDFISNLYTQLGGGPQAIIGVVQLMDARVTYLMGLTEFEYESPSIQAVTHSPESAVPGQEIVVNAQVSNASMVKLAYRYSPFGVFEKVDMFDDGQHDEGAAGDGNYGASLVAGSTNTQYYVYAENAQAAAFSPVRAEYEFYEIEVSNPLVINEFMADNESTIADQDGEFEDWIEIYNNSTEAINLAGYYLSDDPNEPAKWAFPDTTLMADGYLIVWADKDLDQAGLHADIKLSADGETIILSGQNLNLLDLVSFGLQKADTTTGRYPNGTGDFTEMLPTFGAENQNALLVQNETPFSFSLNLRNYPNPFSQSTQIAFNLPAESPVVLEIYNLFGQKTDKLVSQSLRAGSHEYSWNRGNAPSGVYICRLIVGNQTSSLKILVE